MTFGENLKKAREGRGLTQQALADLLHVTRQAVSRWENEARCPDIYMVERIAEVLEISMDEIMTGEKGAENVTDERAYVQPGKMGREVVADSGSLLLILYIAAALLYFFMGAMGTLALLPELLSTKAAFSALLSWAHFNMVPMANDLCYLILFILMVIGICFCAAGALRPKRVGILMGLHYGVYFMSWMVMTVFLLEKDADFPDRYLLSVFVTMALPCVLTVWYFFSERRIPFWVLLLPAVALLPGIAWNIWAMARGGIGLVGILTSMIQILPRLLVQALIVYQGYLWQRVRGKQELS